MPSTLLLLKQLAVAFPDIRFQQSNDFRWLPSRGVIEFDANDPRRNPRLLHEVAHYRLRHSSYVRDIELVGMECDAWHYAVTVLAPQFHQSITSDTVEDDMDTYRDWLHARSSCPRCDAVGLQISKHSYRCLICSSTWRVNRAMSCQLRRYQSSSSQKALP